MEDSEKMAALKRAYADIILNSAKEAATRIMASERKAVRFQQELCCTKDEALRMLVRLKQMMDSKTIEAEMTSLTQQEKIDELEAQLHEAEDIITDLRSELEWFRNKFKKQNNHSESSEGRTVKEDKSATRIATPQNISTSPSNLGLEAALTSDMKRTFLNDRVGDSNFCNTTKVTERIAASGFRNYSILKSDLPSIFVRSKESEQYRNGCTQRIRALDGNLFNGKLLQDGNDQQSSATVKNMDFVKKNHQEKQQPVESCPLRKIQIQYGKTKATSCNSHPDLSVKSCQSSFVLSSCKRADEATNILSTEDDRRDKMITNGDLEEKSTSHTNECTVTDHEPISCNNDSSLAFVGADSCIYRLKAAESECKMKSLPRLNPGLTLIKSNMDPKSGLKNATDGLKMLSQSSHCQHAANTDKELRHESVVENGEVKVKVAENSTVPCLSQEMVNASVIASDQNKLKALEEVHKSPCKTDTDKFLKYTFQRKRKKESSIDPDNTTSPEPSAMKRRAGEKQNAASEKQFVAGIIKGQ